MPNTRTTPTEPALPSVTETALRQALLRTLVLPLLLILFLASLLLWQVQRLLDANAAVDRSNRVIADARKGLRLFVDMESGFRGYLVTGEKDFLDPYWDANKDLPSVVSLLRSEVKDDPEEQRLLEKVLRHYLDWKEYSREGIRRKRDRGDFLSLVLTRRGKDDMERIRTGMTDLMSLEERERDKGNIRAQTAARRTVTGGLLVSIALGALLAFTTRREIRGISAVYAQALAERRRAEEGLQFLNATLEERVVERTEALREQARILAERARLLDLAHDTILVRRFDGPITFWNQGAEEMYGWSRKEALGRNSSEFLKTRFPEPFEAIEAKVRENGRWEGELVHTRRDGRTIIVASRWALNTDEHGKVAGILEINSDITERRAAEDLLKDYATRLEQSNRELQDFAVVASHDLQEPLRKIQAFGGLLHDEYAATIAGEGREYLEEMVSAARRMQHLIQALLTLSRIASRGQPFVRVDLTLMAHEAVRDVQTRLEESDGRVEIGDLPAIDADPVQMRQLFQNLIGNSLKFRRAGAPPVVDVRAEIVEPDHPAYGPLPSAEGAVCRIRVRDNGIGFDPKYVDRIFAPFQRLHGRGAYEGTGMGLTICRRIAERHGGTITADSVPGEGTTFIVTLPAYHERREDTT